MGSSYASPSSLLLSLELSFVPPMEKLRPCPSESSTTNTAAKARTISSNAAPKHASGFGDPLLLHFKKFRASSRPARFLAFEENAWVDFPRPVFDKLSAGFTAGKALFEVSIDGTTYLFDFLRLVKIDMSTEAASSIAWIDVDGRCFFPRPVSAPKTVPFPGVETLAEGNRFYKSVEKLFLDGMRRAGSDAVVTKVYNCPYSGSSPGDWRLEAFRTTMVTTKEARGEANATYGWYGASTKDVAALVQHGFVKANSGELGVQAHGHGVHLSPQYSPYKSSLLAQADAVSGERHIVLCRVILGNSERVEAGSSQSHPSDGTFDSAVDDLDDPKWYVVWASGVNARIIPKYVVSFKTFSRPQGRRREVSSSRWPECRLFQKLFEALGRDLPSSMVQAIGTLYNQHKAGKVSKDALIKSIRSIVGDKLLASTITRMQGGSRN